MKIPFVDLKIQYQENKTEIDGAIQAVIEKTAFVGGYNNPFVKEFESAYAAYCGADHCVSCGNGTDSLEILLKCFGIGAGDEVIVPAFTWISTSESVSTVGATPIFVDAHPDLYTIDPTKIEEKITAKTKAIIPVHIYGLPAPMDEIMQIARKHNLIVIEDAAQAHGALYKGKKAGTIGHAGSFSFFPGKNLGAYGDAGGIVTNDAEIAEKFRMYANHGQIKKHDHRTEGRNSRMDGIHAAVLNAKLPHLEKWTGARIAHATAYNELLKNTGIKLPTCPADFRHVYHLYVVQVENRDRVYEYMREKEIEVLIHYPNALPFLPPYAQKTQPGEFSVASDATKKILSLPMYPELTREQIKRVVDTLIAAVEN